METLNNDLISYILTFLPYQELYPSSLVSKRFRECTSSHQIWKIRVESVKWYVSPNEYVSIIEDSKINWKEKFSALKEAEKRLFTSTYKIKLIVEEARKFGLIDESHEQIAAFLFRGIQYNIDKRNLGEYLTDWRNKDIIPHYHKFFNFKGIDLFMSIRIYLSTFKLPGEASKIDRLMEAFGNVWYNQNPDCGMASGDTIYIITFGIIMLNTDLHNLNIKNKMTLNNWISQMKGIDNGQDVDINLLKDLYYKVYRYGILNGNSNVKEMNGKLELVNKVQVITFHLFSYKSIVHAEVKNGLLKFNNEGQTKETVIDLRGEDCTFRSNLTNEFVVANKEVSFTFAIPQDKDTLEDWKSAFAWNLMPETYPNDFKKVLSNTYNNLL